MELNRINFSGVMNRLNQLSLESHRIITDYQQDTNNDYKNEFTNLANELLNKVNTSYKDAQIFNVICDLIKKYEVELENMSSQVQMLTNENNWLRDELLQTRVKLERFELELIENKSRIQHLEFIQTTKIDNDKDKNGITMDYDLSQLLANKLIQDSSYSCRNNENEKTDDIFYMNQFNLLKDTDDDTLSTLQNYSKESNIIGNNSRLKTIHDLVLQALNEKKYEVAIPLCKEAIEQTEKTNGTRIHEDVAAILNLLAVVYKDQENYTEACQVLDECLQIREQIYGDDHPIVASALNNLSVLYGKKKQFVQAEILCRRALTIRKSAFGDDHPDVAKQLLNLAILSQNQAKYDAAEEFYKQSYDIYINNFGPSSAHALKLYHKIANVCIKLKKYNKSEIILKKLIVYAYNEFMRINISFDHNKTHLSKIIKPNIVEHYNSQKRVPNNDDIDNNINANKLGKYEEFGEWHKSTSDTLSIPSLWSVLKSLLLLYKKSSNTEYSSAVSNVLKNLQKPTFQEDLQKLFKKLNIIIH